MPMMPQMRPALVIPSPSGSMRPARISVRSLLPMIQAMGPRKLQITKERIPRVRTPPPTVWFQVPAAPRPIVVVIILIVVTGAASGRPVVVLVVVILIVELGAAREGWSSSSSFGWCTGRRTLSAAAVEPRPRG